MMTINKLEAIGYTIGTWYGLRLAFAEFLHIKGEKTRHLET